MAKIIKKLSRLMNGLTKGEIIVYSRSIIKTYFLLSHEWWVPLIKFMMGPTIHVREEIMHL